MARRTFTPADVQALIPTLETIFGQLVVLGQEIQAGKEALEASTLSEAGAEALKAKMDRARKLVAQVNELGGVVKDLQRGLVDFPWAHEGKIALLCWQFGEKHIHWWHSEDEGFAGRKPLSASAPRRPELLN